MLQIVICVPSPRMSDSPRGAKLAPFATWRQPGATWRMRYFEFMLTLSPRGAILAPCGATWRHFGAMWRCEHNFTYHCTSPRGGVATWRQKMANLKFPFAILAPRGATWRHKFAKMAPLWRYSALAILWRHVAPNARHVAPLWRHVAPFWRHFGATWRHKVRMT